MKDETAHLAETLDESGRTALQPQAMERLAFRSSGILNPDNDRTHIIRGWSRAPRLAHYLITVDGTVHLAVPIDTRAAGADEANQDIGSIVIEYEQAPTTITGADRDELAHALQSLYLAPGFATWLLDSGELDNRATREQRRCSLTLYEDITLEQKRSSFLLVRALERHCPAGDGQRIAASDSAHWFLHAVSSYEDKVRAIWRLMTGQQRHWVALPAAWKKLLDHCGYVLALGLDSLDVAPSDEIRYFFDSFWALQRDIDVMLAELKRASRVATLVD